MWSCHESSSGQWWLSNLERTNNTDWLVPAVYMKWQTFHQDMSMMTTKTSFCYCWSLWCDSSSSNTSCRSGASPPLAHNWLVLTGWRRRNPSGRRCGPWRGQKLPSSRLGGCTGTRWGCSTVGYRPGSWGRCEHYQGRETVWKQCVSSLVCFACRHRSWLRENCIVNNTKNKQTKKTFIHLWLRR